MPELRLLSEVCSHMSSTAASSYSQSLWNNLSHRQMGLRVLLKARSSNTKENAAYLWSPYDLNSWLVPNYQLHLLWALWVIIEKEGKKSMNHIMKRLAKEKIFYKNELPGICKGQMKFGQCFQFGRKSLLLDLLGVQRCFLACRPKRKTFFFQWLL